MTSVTCTQCGAENDPSASKWNYCEKCGARLAVVAQLAPAAAAAGARTDLDGETPRRGRWSDGASKPSTASSASSWSTPSSASPPAVRKRPHPMAYVVMTLGVVLGATAMLIIDGGSSDRVWIGCGVGAFFGVLSAQMLGLMPKRA
jgi:hypothetical protein